jgi:beta-hydroxylase
VVFDPGQFPFVAELEANWKVVRREAQGVLAYREYIPAFQDISPDQYRISNNAMWKTFWFYGFGHRSGSACSACPETARLLDSVPGLETALFSILAPRKHIPAHRGVYKDIINYHLGLIVPKDRDRCRIRVADQVFHWEEGTSAIFDDTNEHEVWNDTDEERVVLMLQFRRPLRLPGDQLSRLFLRVLRTTPYVTRAWRNHGPWERRFADAVREHGRAGFTATNAGRD